MKKGKDYKVKKDAYRLKNNQESEAILLKEQQALVASDLTTVQANRDSMNNSTIEVSRKRAASALLTSQNKAAAALKDSNEDHARMLKKAYQTSKEKIKEKDSCISWMSGGYSVENEEE
jgi:hypothetical protein